MPDLDVRRAAKFWVALIGLVASTVLASLEEAPRVLVVVAAVASAVAVYLVPNETDSFDQ